jgi:IrrE N-terminal-like domain
MMTGEWNYDEALSHADMTALCEQKRDQLLERVFGEHPELEEMWPAEIVEDALLFCGFRVVDEPLPKYQLALCDMGQRLVVVNSEMGSFLHKWCNLVSRRRVTLAHELGHVILHWSEISLRVFRSYQGDGHEFVDTRAAQKEYEADLFSRVMLVPEELLRSQRESRYFLNALEERKPVKPSTLSNWVRRLSGRFKVTPALMKSRLEDMGWLHPTRKNRGWKYDLRLRIESWAE